MLEHALPDAPDRPIRPPVVVGVDGSDDSLAAVDLAVTEASRRRLPLQIVHAFTWPLFGVPLDPSPLGPPEAGLRYAAEQVVEEARLRAVGAAPHLEVSARLDDGQPATVLLAAAEAASLVVLGSRGLGGFSGLLVGSVGVQVASHAACPVVIVPWRFMEDDEETAPTVVVGVDGSATSGSAVGFAFEEASLRRAALVALHAYRFPVPVGPGDIGPAVVDEDGLADEERRVLAEALAGWREKFPDVTVSSRLVRAHAADALVTAATGAQLLVVGSRGRGGFRGLLLGSVSQAVLHHARCPVAVVRP